MAELSSDVMRGYNDVIVLSVLAEGDSYGYEISRYINERSCGRYPIKETTLYSTFSRLERSGFISAYVGSETFGKQRTYYTITDAGRSYLVQKCEEWQLAKDVIGAFIDKFMQ